MDLYAKFLYPEHGWLLDRDRAQKAGLEIDTKYLITNINMQKWVTYIALDGFEGAFNSTQFKFEDAEGNSIDIFDDPKYNINLAMFLKGGSI